MVWADVHVDGVRFQRLLDGFTPLHRADAAPAEKILPADVKQVIGVPQAVHVKVEQRQGAALILVDDGEGGAGHPLGNAQALGHAPDKGGLSRPQVAGEGHHSTRGQPLGHLPADGLGFLFAC